MEDILLFDKDIILTRNDINALSMYLSYEHIVTTNLLNTSSNNLVVNIDDKYVFKIKTNEIPSDIQVWHEKIFNILDSCKLCQIYLNSKNGKKFINYNNHNYCIMKLYSGYNFEFDNKRQLNLVSLFIKKLQKIKIPKELNLDENMILSMPKSEMHLLCSNFDLFCNNVYNPIVEISKKVNANIKELDLCLDLLKQSDLNKRFSKLRMTLSHGELQGQNLLFNNSDIIVLDWDSISIRPAIYDIAMSICFLCRTGRGNFIIDLQKYDYYIEPFSLTSQEKECLPLFMIGVFIPDIKLLMNYFNENTQKAKWYLDWSCNAISDIFESFFNKRLK